MSGASQAATLKPKLITCAGCMQRTAQHRHPRAATMPARAAVRQQRADQRAQVAVDQREHASGHQDLRGIEHVLAGRAPVHEHRGLRVRAGDGRGQLPDDRNRERAGARAVGDDRVDVEALGSLARAAAMVSPAPPRGIAPTAACASRRARPRHPASPARRRARPAPASPRARRGSDRRSWVDCVAYQGGAHAPGNEARGRGRHVDIGNTVFAPPLVPALQADVEAVDRAAGQPAALLARAAIRVLRRTSHSIRFRSPDRSRSPAPRRRNTCGCSGRC